MPTTNPVPSQDPSDLLFNAGRLDEVVNGTANSFTDRLGVSRRTVAGMNADFDAQLADAESDLNVYRADAAASAAEALGYLQTIRATSYGAYAEDPTTDPLGNPPTVGDEYFNTTSNLLKRWNESTWQASDISTANLAASSGSSLVGYDGGTVQDVLDGAKSLQDYAALRAYTGRAKRIYITGLLVAAKPVGIAGTFQHDSTDTTSLDNGGTIIVGADGRRWKRDFSCTPSVGWFGAKGVSTDDTSAIFAAISAYVDVDFPPGVYQCGEINLPARNVNIVSDGATIQGISGTSVFKQRKRGYLTRISGLAFTGNAIAFNYDSDDVSLPSGTQQYEYRIDKCQFLQAYAIPAVRLYGAREGVIDNCRFSFNQGIYTEFSINTVVSNCQWKNCSYMILSKLGSEGLIVSNAVALGCSFGLRCERTTGVQLINSMIDYCDAPVYLKGATDVLISNNYISTRTVAPAIHAVKYDDGFRGYNHVISHNNIRDNYSTTGSACIRYEETDFFDISNNILSNYASYGIVYTSCTQGDISGNKIRNRSGLGTNSILALVDDATVRVHGNRLTQAINRSNNTSTWNNAGFITEAYGEAIVGAGSSSVVVTHGMSITPNKLLITLTPTTPETETVGYYVSATTSTTFTITLDAVVSATTAFAWQAKSRP